MIRFSVRLDVGRTIPGRDLTSRRLAVYFAVQLLSIQRAILTGASHRQSLTVVGSKRCVGLRRMQPECQPLATPSPASTQLLATTRFAERIRALFYRWSDP